MPNKTTLTPQDVKNITDQADNLRDKLIISFYYSTGVRVSEFLSVTFQNVDFENGTVLIPHLKRGVHKVCPKCKRQGGRAIKFCSRCGSDMSKIVPIGISERSRIIGIDSDLIQLIKDYIKGKKLKKTDPIISLTRQSVYSVVRKLSEKAGLGGKIMLNPETGRYHYVHTHDFRSSLATDWLEMAKTDVNKQKALQTLLGHSDFGTSMRYNRLTSTQMDDTHKEFKEFREGKK
jgi:integrase